jgi:hypothetical protein
MCTTQQVAALVSYGVCRRPRKNRHDTRGSGTFPKLRAVPSVQVRSQLGPAMAGWFAHRSFKTTRWG